MKGITYSEYKHTGIVSDIPAEEVDPLNWTSGINFQFIEQSSTRVNGYKQVFGTPSVAPIHALNVTYAGTSYWIYCGVNSVYVTDGGTHWNITPFAGLTTVPQGAWTSCILNGLPVLNNGIDPPMYWNLSTSVVCQPLPGWPANTSCKVMRSFKYHLFALNITSSSVNYQDSVWWSKAAEPGSIPTEWTPTTTNDAGDIVLSDTLGEIIDGLSLRDSFVVYKANATYSLNYIGGNAVYSQRKNFLTTGLQTRNCISEINGNHFIFTGTDVVKHDGQTFISLVNNKVKNQLLALIDTSNINLCCLVYNASKNQLWINIPETGKTGLSLAYIVNTITGDIGKRELPNLSYITKGIVVENVSTTWNTDTETWAQDITIWNQSSYSTQADTLLFVDKNNTKFYSVDSADTNNGTAITAYIERLSLPIDTEDLYNRKLIVRIIPRVEGKIGDKIYVKIGTQSVVNDPIQWSDDLTYTIGTDLDLKCTQDGRLISIRFFSSTTAQWKVHSYQVEFITQGLF